MTKKLSFYSLKQALDNLETFTQQIEKELVPNLSHLKVQEGKLVVTSPSSLKKTIALAYNFIISSKVKEQSSEVLNEILHSSDIIKSYFPLIQGMEEGTAEQKTFALYANNAIKRFNDVVDRAATKSPSWKKKFARLFYGKRGLLVGDRLIKIDLPQRAFLHIDFPQLSSTTEPKRIGNVSPISSDTSSEKISLLREMVIPTFQVQRQTLELYYMKIIALLERHKLMSNKDARLIVLRTPTQLTIDKESHLLTISQHLIPIPGQYVEISASFRMDPRTLNYNIFHEDHLSIESAQTGFPHPLQHQGWSLSEVLIPRCLHRPNRLQYFPALLNIMNQYAQDLLPNGPLADKARLILRYKRQAFEEHKDEFIAYHKALSLSIAEAAPTEIVDPCFAEVAGVYFDMIADHIAPFDFLSNTNEELMTTWITIPYRALERAWASGKVSTLDEAKEVLSREMQQVKATSALYIGEERDSNKLNAMLYINSMGQILCPSIQQLILQQYSELMKGSPPKLDLFTKKLQTALYLQLWEFQHELVLEPKETDFFRRLSRLLEDDITLFKAHDLQSLHWDAVATVLELEAYYVKRAQEL